MADATAEIVIINDLPHPKKAFMPERDIVVNVSPNGWPDRGLILSPKSYTRRALPAGQYDVTVDEGMSGISHPCFSGDDRVFPRLVPVRTGPGHFISRFDAGMTIYLIAKETKTVISTSCEEVTSWAENHKLQTFRLEVLSPKRAEQLLRKLDERK